MKFYLSILFLTLIFFGNIKAQEEISQLKPCPTPPTLTKAEVREIKRIKKESKYIIYGEPIEIFVGIETKILSSEKTVGIIKFQTNSYELTWTDFGEKGSLVTKLNFFVKTTSIDTKFDRCFEGKVRFQLKEEVIKNKTPILYQIPFELPKGIYTLEFFVRDIETGKIGEQKIKFEIK